MNIKHVFIFLILLFQCATSTAQKNTETKPDSSWGSVLSWEGAAAIFSGLGILSSCDFAVVTSCLTKGTIAYNFFERYSADKMKSALRLMGDMRREHKNAFIGKWILANGKKDQWASDVEDARHATKYFYRDVATLYQSQCMSYPVAKKICSTGGIHIFMTTILEMDGLINPCQIDKEFKPMPEIYKAVLKLERQKKYRDVVKRYMKTGNLPEQKLGRIKK